MGLLALGVGVTLGPGPVWSPISLSAGLLAGVCYGLGARWAGVGLPRWSWHSARSRLGSAALVTLLFAGLFAGVARLLGVLPSDALALGSIDGALVG